MQNCNLKVQLWIWPHLISFLMLSTEQVHLKKPVVPGCCRYSLLYLSRNRSKNENHGLRNTNLLSFISKRKAFQLQKTSFQGVKTLSLPELDGNGNYTRVCSLSTHLVTCRCHLVWLLFSMKGHNIVSKFLTVCCNTVT